MTNDPTREWTKSWQQRAKQRVGAVNPPQTEAEIPKSQTPKPGPGGKFFVPRFIANEQKVLPPMVPGTQYRPSQAFPNYQQINNRWLPTDYTPSYWEDPQNVSRWYKEYKAGNAPEWLRGDKIEQAYQYMKFANQGAEDAGWKFLHPDDPGRGWLQSIDTPPLDVVLPPGQYQDMVMADMFQRPSTEWSEEDYAKLTEVNRQRMQEYASAVAETTPLEDAPWWQRAYIGLSSQPWAMGAFQAGGLGLITGGPAGALVGGGLGAGLGALSSLPAGSPLGELARGAMQLLDLPYQQVERLYGTALQYIAPDHPYLGEDMDRVFKELRAAWAASGGAMEAGVPFELSTQYPSSAMFYLDQAMKVIGEDGTVASVIGKGGRFDPLNMVAFTEYAVRKGMQELGFDVDPDVVKLAGLNQAYTLETIETVDGPRVISKPVDVGYAGMAALVDARRRILRGEDPARVQEELKARFGVSGQIADLAGGIVLDPLNILPEVGTHAAGKVFELSGFELFGKTMQRSTGPLEAIRRYGVEVRTGAAGPATQLTNLQRLVAGIDEMGSIKELSANKPTNVVARAWSWFTGLTDSSKARIQVGIGSENIGNFLLMHMDDLDSLVRNWDVLATQRPEEAAKIAAAFGSPEMYTIQRHLATFSDILKQEKARFDQHATTRDLLARIANATGTNVQELVKLLDSVEDANQVISQLQAKARQVVDSEIQQPAIPEHITSDMRKALKQMGIPESIIRKMTPEQAYRLLGNTDASPARITPERKQAAQAFLDSFDPNRRDGAFLDAKRVADLQEIYTGKDPVPYDPHKFVASMYGKFEDHLAKQLSLMYNLKPDHAIFRYADTLKKAQSLLLLGLNPAYLFNNVTNNAIMMAAGGIFGMHTEAKIDRFFLDDIGMSPYRYEAGVGAAGILPEERILSTTGVEEMRTTGAGEVEIRKATKSTGLQGKVNRVLNSANKLGFISEASRKLESSMSKQAMYMGYKREWAGRWKRNVGFSLMEDAGLVGALREIDEGLPKAIYALIEGSHNEKQLANVLHNILDASYREYALDVYLPDVAAELGLDVNVMKDDMSPFYDDLRDGLRTAKTDEEVHRLFRETRRRIQDHADALTAAELAEEAAHIATVMENGGWVEALRLGNDLHYENYEMAVKNAISWQKVYDMAEEMYAAGASDAAVNALFREHSISVSQDISRARAHHASKYQGVLQAWGMSDERVRSYEASITSQNKIWRDYYDLVHSRRQRVLQETRGLPREQRMARWQALEVELHDEFIRAQSSANQIARTVDDLFVDVVADRFGTQAGVEATRWRDQLRDLEDTRQMTMRTHRESMLNATGRERREGWVQFYNEEYLPMMYEHYNQQTAALLEVYNRINGNPSNPPIPPQAPPPPPITPGGGAPPPTPRPQGANTPEGTPPTPEELFNAPPELTPDEIGRRQLIDIADEFGMEKVDKKGKEIGFTNRLIHAWNIVRKYLPEAKDLSQVEINALPPEAIRQAFRNREAAQAAEAAARAAREAAAQGTPTYKLTVGTIDDAPPHISAAMRAEAQRMLAELDTFGGNPLIPDPDRSGKFIRREPTPTTTDWYRDVKNEWGEVGREPLVNALNRVLAGGGADAVKGKMVWVQRMKDVIISRLMYGAGEVPYGDIGMLMHFGEIDEAARSFIAQGLDDPSIPDDVRLQAVGTPENLEMIRQHIDDQVSPLPDPEGLDAPTVEEIRQTRNETRTIVEGFITRQNVKDFIENDYLQHIDNKIEGLSDAEVTHAYMEMMDAHAQVWAIMNNSTPERWYSESFGGLRLTDQALDPNGQIARGITEPLDNHKLMITITKAGDVGSFAHELGHVFLYDLPPSDVEIVYNWLGVEDGIMTRQNHEDFANGLEVYLSEGRAPTPRLANVFQKFSAWIKAIYQRIVGDWIPDEVRGVYDRLFALDEAGDDILRPPEPEPPQPSFTRGGQGVMFGAGEDTPLFSGTPMPGQESVFRPTETGQQPVMPGMEEAYRPPMHGAVEGGEAAGAGPLFSGRQYSSDPDIAALEQIIENQELSREVRQQAQTDREAIQKVGSQKYRGTVETIREWLDRKIESGANKIRKAGPRAYLEGEGQSYSLVSKAERDYVDWALNRKSGEPNAEIRPAGAGPLFAETPWKQRPLYVANPEGTKITTSDSLYPWDVVKTNGENFVVVERFGKTISVIPEQAWDVDPTKGNTQHINLDDTDVISAGYNKHSFTGEPNAEIRPVGPEPSGGDVGRAVGESAPGAAGLPAETVGRLPESPRAGEPQRLAEQPSVGLRDKAWARGLRSPEPTRELTNPRVNQVLDETSLGQITDARRILSAFDRGNNTYVLANGTGTGKTFVAIGALIEQNPKKALVVVPNRNLATQWRNVAQEHFGYEINVGKEIPDSGTWVTTYTTLREKYPQLMDAGYDMIIFDESHKLKTYGKEGGAVQAEAAAKVVGSNPNANTLYMSATPFQSIQEMKYLENLGLWDKTDPLGFDRFLEDHGYNFIDNDFGGYWRFDGDIEDIIDVYRQMTQQGVLSQRELKMDVDLQNQFVRVPLRDDAGRAYNQINSQFDDAVSTLSSRVHKSIVNAQRTIALRRVMELSKIDDAIRLAQQMLDEGRQVAIFTGYRNEAKVPHFKSPYLRHVNGFLDGIYDGIDKLETQSIQKVVDALGGESKVAQVHGGKASKMRDLAIDAYQSGKKKVMVATAAAGGTGLSLHDTVGNAPRAQINAYMPWSGQDFQQVAGRSYRFGSKTDVKQYWLFSDTPKEAKIAAVVGGRLSEMGALVNGIKMDANANRIAAFDFDLLDSAEGNRLFQSASPNLGPVGDTPPGVVDQIASPRFSGEHEGDIWSSRVSPMLNDLESHIIRRGQVSGRDLPPELSQKLADYEHKVRGQMASSRIATTRQAEQMRDFALLNYSRRRGFDMLLGLVYPYQYFYTRSLFNWFQRAVDQPAWFSQWARIRSMQDRNKRQGYPSRLANKVKIAAPYLPEWAGDSVYYDPIKKMFPFEEFLGPLQQFIGNKRDIERQTEWMLQRWVNDGSITEQAAQGALRDKNEIYQSAMTAVKAEDSNTADYNWLNTLMSPALYLTLPAFMATGKNPFTGESDNSLLPITRTGLGIEAATENTPLQGVGKAIGSILSGPEQLIRRKAGLNEFGSWGDYYIDRELSNMAADGTISTDAAVMAMMERTGQAYDDARERVRYTQGLSVPGAAPIQSLLTGQPWKNPASFMMATMFGWLPAGLLPEGELQQRGLANIYKVARSEYNAGNTKALQDFFEKYPEYESRLALFDTPDERLRQFLVSEVYDRYYALDSRLQKQLARDQLGPDFQSFLEGNHDDIDPQTLATWSRMMGGRVPNAEPVQPIAQAPDILIDKLQFAPPEDAAVVDTYRNLRDELFPNYYALQSRYFSFPPKSQARRDFLKQFPQLKDYWEWNKSYKARYPVIEQYTTQPSASAAMDYSWLSDLDPLVLRQLYTYYGMNVPLSSGAIATLQDEWARQGQPGTFESWLDNYVKQGIAP